MNSELDARIRRAVSAGEFGKASELWETYAALVVDAVRGRTCSAADLAPMRELIDWTRRVVLCAHAHNQRRMAARNTKLHAAAAYARLLR